MVTAKRQSFHETYDDDGHVQSARMKVSIDGTAYEVHCDVDTQEDTTTLVVEDVKTVLHGRFAGSVSYETMVHLAALMDFCDVFAEAHGFDFRGPPTIGQRDTVRG